MPEKGVEVPDHKPISSSVHATDGTVPVGQTHTSADASTAVWPEVMVRLSLNINMPTATANDTTSSHAPTCPDGVRGTEVAKNQQRIEVAKQNGKRSVNLTHAHPAADANADGRGGNGGNQKALQRNGIHDDQQLHQILDQYKIECPISI